MKNLILSAITSFLIISCSEKKPDTNTHIIGNIKGLSSGTLYLQKMVDTALVAIDTVKIEGDSKFQIDLNLNSPEMFYLFLDRGVTNSLDNNLPVFAEPGTITINTELDYFYANAKITGSKNQELFEQFQKVNTRYNGELLEISKEKFDAIRFKRLQDIDSINKKLDQKLTRKYLFAINFALNNKDHEVAPYVALTELANTNIKYLDTINKSMTPKVAESKYGKLLKSYLIEITKKN